MMAKRKVGYKSALTNNNTPKESLSDAEFAAEYAGMRSRLKARIAILKKESKVSNDEQT